MGVDIQMNNYKKKSELRKLIEEKREELNKMVSEDTGIDKEILKKSMELDELIVEYMKLDSDKEL